MSDFVTGLCLGWSLGFGGAWLYFRMTRLIRSRHEWYRDPVIRSRYPEEAEKALRGPDGW